MILHYLGFKQLGFGHPVAGLTGLALIAGLRILAVIMKLRLPAFHAPGD